MRRDPWSHTEKVAYTPPMFCLQGDHALAGPTEQIAWYCCTCKTIVLHIIPCLHVPHEFWSIHVDAEGTCASKVRGAAPRGGAMSMQAFDCGCQNLEFCAGIQAVPGWVEGVALHTYIHTYIHTSFNGTTTRHSMLLSRISSTFGSRSREFLLADLVHAHTRDMSH